MQSVQANEVTIVDVTARCSADSCDFNVTLEHADSGWEHYANAWEVHTLDGQLLGKRVLAHPHVDEQPFTRSLRAVAIPHGVNEVAIKAFDSVHGEAPKVYRVKLTR